MSGERPKTAEFEAAAATLAQSCGNCRLRRQGDCEGVKQEQLKGKPCPAKRQ